MMKKRGYFFSLDAITAIGVMVIGIVLVLISTSYQPSETSLVFISTDLMNTLQSTNVFDINEQEYSYVEKLKNNSNITNLDNTILEQIGEFLYRESEYSCTYCREMAANFTRDLTNFSVPEQYSFEILVNNESIFNRSTTNPTSQPLKNQSSMLMPSKRLFSGIINRTDVWGPYTAEVIVWQ